MPTAAMREGDFSGLVDGQGRLFTLYDPMTTDAGWRRQAFPGNRIPVNRRSPLATYLYNVTPLPTHPNVNPLVGDNWFGLGFNNRQPGYDDDTDRPSALQPRPDLLPVFAQPRLYTG